ncbi:hypothetical protein JK358_34905 [Nocardia sp. 2]|uniref:Mce-associated membrane protein n=1 Tax=Nocardia acididurans TaxID=2802282 RepID=A0ABS1MG60_9NOCA|nr:hypothetical protein [Nocardia acididurans]
MLAGAVVTALLIGCAVLGGLWWSARADLHAAAVVADNAARAERTATEYAVGAATVDYQHMDEWIVRLKANTTSVLANKFDATGPKLGEILAPLQWTSTATPVAAKVMSDKNGVYVVDVFLNVTSSSSQSPAGTQTTVTYSITLDRGAGWMISDVGGMTAALPSK